MRLPLLAFVCGSSLAAAQPAVPPPASETLEQLVVDARAARVKGDIPNWIRLGTKVLELTPDHPDILISIARAHAAAGNKDQSLAKLGDAVRRGAAFDPGRFPEFKSLEGDGRFDALAANAKQNLAPVGKATRFAKLPEGESEGIAYDQVSRRLFAGTGNGELLAIDEQGKVSTFASGGGLRQILGIKVDAARRLVWLVSGRYPEPDAPADSGTGGIRAYDLDSGAIVKTVEVDERPILHGFNDLALAKDGTVYVTDTNRNSVYKLAPGGKILELLLQDGRMTFPNGIVLTSDQRTLFVTHVEGISAVDVRTGARRLLSVPADASVNSIDGLLLHDGQLYAVQNSPYLDRIVGIALSPDGRSIERVRTLSSHTPAGLSHTTAAIAGDHLYMVGGTPQPDVYGGTNPAKSDSGIWRIAL
ncbi:SMP-30/gluconolactonase/LRE family protein [Sphingomonas sp. NSE70-1]|uniref:SMP-30/gluconolactonase/LRE family protein n=1 Tax=Sphingomonas caseinilyticus TaxID=2908205 RepID=A0ABT0RXS1_9SPHN|nr:SMP-30/gluconolactonase/LRE family protein [Sphingomonas caseinilyticus]MCL6699819.1 SMP-30/gluconolactonase/LRE family protein [Sphingomonas caseinilyticus]